MTGSFNLPFKVMYDEAAAKDIREKSPSSSHLQENNTTKRKLCQVFYFIIGHNNHEKL